jgi:hypothetical protein
VLILNLWKHLLAINSTHSKVDLSSIHSLFHDNYFKVLPVLPTPDHALFNLLLDKYLSLRLPEDDIFLRFHV